MFLFNHKIRLHYDTTPAQIGSILTAIRELLQRHPLADLTDDRAGARLIEFADSGFTIEVFLYLRVRNIRAYLPEQEKLLLSILDVILAAGCSVGVPSRSLYITGDKPQNSTPIEQMAARIQQQRAQVTSASAGGASGNS